MPKSIAIFGAGPGLGQAIARRYGREGYDVVLVARRKEPLDQLAKELSAAGVTAHVVTGDLSRTDLVPALAEQIRARVGDPTALYYAPATGATGFVPAATLSPAQLQDLMPMMVYTLLALVQEFLPAMVERGDGAILSAQGVSAIQGWAQMSGPAAALAAHRNYLQSLSAEVADRGVYVGQLYIGARILGSAADAEHQAAKAAGLPMPDLVAVEPADLADQLWIRHATANRDEVTFPANLFA